MIMLMMKYMEFSERKDAIFAKIEKSNIKSESSGSLGIYYDQKCHRTYPNNTLFSDPKSDWCSNIADSNSKPWVLYNIKNKGMKLNGYAIRNGCCNYYYCCCSDDGKLIDYECCCALYSFSLHGSNDNITWSQIHKVEKDKYIRYCEIKTYEFPQTESYNYIKFVLDEPWPGCQNCMQLNQIELYGDLVDSTYFASDVYDDSDESISIIGKVFKKNDE